jgi:uncharacterized protein
LFIAKPFIFKITTMSLSADQPKNHITPIEQSERIIILDSLRGIAVLGILLLNISGFGLPSGINEDPSVLNETGLNYYCWYIFGHGVFEGSFRAVFSMLFGAGAIIFIRNLEKKAEGQIPTEMFVRRQLWLLLFGLFNAFILLWHGDILYHYAICGVVLVAFRSLPPKKLIIASMVCLLLLMARSNIDLYRNKKDVLAGEQIAAMDTTKVKLTGHQKEMLSEMKSIKSTSNPELKKWKIENEIAKYRSGYATLYDFQSDRSLSAETYGMHYFHFFDILVFMFLGMAFFKLGILQGEANTKIYLWMALGGLLIGLPLSRLHVQASMNYHFNPYEVLKHKNLELYELQRSIRSIGIFGLIMLIYKSGVVKKFFKWMQPVGQMAFTNYLSQSFMCGLFFYGSGLGKFARLQRYELYYVVVIVWLIQIVWSHLWLRYFRFGPMEWLWRSLTYWKLQPFRKVATI